MKPKIDTRRIAIIKLNKKRFFTLIFFAHILFYFFKIDRELYAFQEIIPHPHQTYNEQPLIENASIVFTSISGFSKFLDNQDLKINQISIWNSILLSYNSKLLCFLKINKACNYNTLQIVSALFKKNNEYPQSCTYVNTSYPVGKAWSQSLRAGFCL